MDKTQRKAMIKTNLAYILADASNTSILNAQEELDKIFKSIKPEEKRKFKQMIEAAKRLEYLTRDVTKSLYSQKFAIEACEDSDWLYKFMLMFVDRTGENVEKMQKVWDFVEKMDSELGL